MPYRLVVAPREAHLVPSHAEAFHGCDGPDSVLMPLELDEAKHTAGCDAYLTEKNTKKTKEITKQNKKCEAKNGKNEQKTKNIYEEIKMKKIKLSGREQLK